jgi:hypothetical protein
MTTTTAPISLQNLFLDLDYLAGIKDRQKYNFTSRSYVNDDWVGFFWRKMEGETQDIHGISAMENITKNAAEQWITYKKHNTFGPELLDKMVDARHGLERARVTYADKQKTNTASNIKIRAIQVLDNAIPESKKLEVGITLKTKTSSEDTDTKITDEDD